MDKREKANKASIERKNKWLANLSSVEKRAYKYTDNQRKRMRKFGIKKWKVNFRQYVPLFGQMEEFERSIGVTQHDRVFEIDHILPLSLAHGRKPMIRKLMKVSNLQVITASRHKEKTLNDNERMRLERNSKEGL